MSNIYTLQSPSSHHYIPRSDFILVGELDPPDASRTLRDDICSYKTVIKQLQTYVAARHGGHALL